MTESFDEPISDNDDSCNLHEYDLIEEEIQVESFDDDCNEICETIEVEDDFDTEFEKGSVIA